MLHLYDRIHRDVLTPEQAAARLVKEDLVGVVTTLLAPQIVFALGANEFGGRNRFKNVSVKSESDRPAGSKPTPTPTRKKRK